MTQHINGLRWQCRTCNADEPVEKTGGDHEYAVGDKEPCTTCPDGTAVVVASTRLGDLFDSMDRLARRMDTRETPKEFDEEIDALLDRVVESQKQKRPASEWIAEIAPLFPKKDRATEED